VGVKDKEWGLGDKRVRVGNFYKRIYVYTYVYIHMSIHIYVYVYIYIHIKIYIHTFIYMNNIHTYV
jgi:hypothetical protein